MWLGAEGQNEFIWQAWATLEARVGNVAKARKVCSFPLVMGCMCFSLVALDVDILLGRAQLYDAAIVANGSHAAAWHGWGLLEKRQGNPLRARDLWVKARPPQLWCSWHHK